MSQKHYFALGIVILFLAALGFWYKKKQMPLIPQGTETISRKESSSSTGRLQFTDEQGRIVSIKGGFRENTGTATSIPDVPTPDLNRPITVPKTFTAANSAKLKADIEKVSQELRSNPQNVQQWLWLGTLRKHIEDYEGAIVAWRYASLLVPTNPVPLLSIAKTEHFYLKKFVSSEASFRKAIAVVSPKPLPEAYIGLHELYRYSYKEKESLADDVLIEGIKKAPDDIGLMVTLALYYRDTNNNAGARTYFEMALAEARRQNQPALITSLESDLASLK